MSFSLVRWTTKHVKRNTQTIPKTTIKNQWKFGPEAFPNACLKINRKIAATNRQSVNFCLQIGRWERVDEVTFGVFFVPGAPLGARMAPRPLPRASGDLPDLSFQWNLIDLLRFSYYFGSLLNDFCTGESFHILLKLPAVNLENCLQSKVLDNTFDSLIFRPMELGWNQKLSA